MHPTRTSLVEAGRNLVRKIRHLKRAAVVANTMDQSLAGQTVLITGASSGTGRILAQDCAIRGARVLLACRNRKAGEEAERQILTMNHNADLTIYQLDLSSFASVRSFAETIMESEEKVDLLIHNAATMSDFRIETEDSHELTIQVNFLSPVMLTMLLFDYMTKCSADPRIIFVSSLFHGFSKDLFLKDMEWKYFPSFHPHQVFAHSKLALMLFVRELSHRADSRNVRVYAVDTGIPLKSVTKHFSGSLYGKIVIKTLQPFTRTEEEAAESIFSVVLMEKYCHNSDVYYFRDGKEVPVSRIAQNDEKAFELWNYVRDILDLPAMDMLPITSNV